MHLALALLKNELAYYQRLGSEDPLPQVSLLRFGQYCRFCDSAVLFHDESADQVWSAAAALDDAATASQPRQSEEAAALDVVQVVGAAEDDHQLPWLPVP